MNDNSTDSKLENMKLGEDALAAVTGGKSNSTYIVEGSSMVPAYGRPPVGPYSNDSPVAEVYPDVELIRVYIEAFPGWLEVPLCLNMSKFTPLVNSETWKAGIFKSVYIEKKFLREIN
jgi:hypothetical protein